MNLTAALDVITGLVLMYLLLSLFCTAINEFIAWVTQRRARTLRSALQQLIDDPRLQSLFYDHGLIDGTKVASNSGSQTTAAAKAFPDSGAQLAATKQPIPPVTNVPSARAHPSYLSSETVAAAITGSLLVYLQQDSAPASSNAPAVTLQAAIRSLPPDSNIRDTLSACLADAGHDVDEFRANVAQWFDDAMDRLSGAYKRYTQIVSITVGVAVAILLNADTLHVANRLWNDHTLTGAVDQTASTLSSLKYADLDKTVLDRHPEGCTESGDKSSTAGKKPEPKPASKNHKSAAAIANGGSQSAGAPKSGVHNGTDTTDADGEPKLDPIATMCAVNAELHQFPIGWTEPHWPTTSDFQNWRRDTPWRNIFGWLITAIALMQGAPFWFDLLQKIMNFRATGTKPKKAAKPS